MNPNDALSEFTMAHVLFFDLAYGTHCDETLDKTIDDFFSLVLRLGDFVAGVLGKQPDEVSELVTDLIQDERKAIAFLNEHFASIAS